MEIWEEDALKEECIIYLHRFVIHRDYAGRGIGEAFLDWAVLLVKLAANVKFRFDCPANNEGLNHYYQKKYPLKEITPIHSGHCKYEKILWDWK
ncbi:MAG: GNAT family N-acetyltransferase [Bacillota bacterium]